MTGRPGSPYGLSTVEVPLMNIACGKLYSISCLETTLGERESSWQKKKKRVQKTHDLILKTEKQSSFLLSFTRFVACTVDPEKHISFLLKTYSLEEISDFRLLSLVCKSFKKGALPRTCTTSELFSRLELLAVKSPLLFVDKSFQIRFWHHQIGYLVENNCLGNSAHEDLVVLFARFSCNFKLDNAFWKIDGHGKPSESLKALARSVNSTRSCDSLKKMLEKEDERFEDELLDFFIVKIKALVLAYEHLLSHVHNNVEKVKSYCEELRYFCLDLCEKLAVQERMHFPKLLEAWFFFGHETEQSLSDF